ncbi:MAG: RNA-binding S4 domain-containing protein [Terricaulis sp.]
MTAAGRQRVDVWLWHARFTKSRALATKLVAEGGLRLIREGSSRGVEKAWVEVQTGDVLTFPLRGALKAIRVEAVGARRGPPTEARALYSELDAGGVA